MTNESSPPLPTNGRLISAGMAGAAAVGLLVNHFTLETQHFGKLLILCLGPIALSLGIGGMVEPKILWSIGKYGAHLPLIYKVIGGALGTFGLAVTILLLLFVYRLGPPEPKRLPNNPANKKDVAHATPSIKMRRHTTAAAKLVQASIVVADRS